MLSKRRMLEALDRGSLLDLARRIARKKYVPVMLSWSKGEIAAKIAKISLTKAELLAEMAVRDLVAVCSETGMEHIPKTRKAIVKRVLAWPGGQAPGSQPAEMPPATAPAGASIQTSEAPLPPAPPAMLDAPVTEVVRADKLRRALEAVGVETVSDFLAANLDDVLYVRGFGERTRQQLGESRNAIASIVGRSRDGAVTFRSIAVSLSARARRTLDDLGVSDLKGLLDVQESQVLAIRGIGRGTWDEIAQAQSLAGPSRWREEIGRAKTTGISGAVLQSDAAPLTNAALLSLPLFSRSVRDAPRVDQLPPCYQPEFALSRLPLGPRARQAVGRLGIRNLGQLLLTPAERLLNEPNFGQTSLSEVRRLVSDALLSGGLVFSGNEPLSENRLAQMPLFSGKKGLAFDVSLLHKSYHPNEGIGVLDLPVRALSVLKRMRVSTVGHLLAVVPDRMLRCPNCGVTTVTAVRDEVREFLLEANGLRRQAALETDTFDALVDSLFEAAIQNGRTRQITRRRMGLAGDATPTLDDLATELGLSKARIGQIAAKGIVLLAKPRVLRLLQPLKEAALNALSAVGGLDRAKALGRQLMEKFRWPNTPPAAGLTQLLAQFPEFDSMVGNGLIALGSFQCHKCPLLEPKFTTILADEAGQVHILDFAHRLAASCGQDCSSPAGAPERFSEAAVEFLASHAGDAVVKEGQVFTSKKWRILSGEDLVGLLHLVLEEKGEAAHYKDIASRAHKVAAYAQGIPVSRVCSCLRREGFVLVGPGTYALASWGVERYKTHAEAIMELLENTGTPLGGLTIIKRLTKEGYKEANLRAALYSDQRISQVGHNLYDLKQRAGSGSEATTAADLTLVLGNDPPEPCSLDQVGESNSLPMDDATSRERAARQGSSPASLDSLEPPRIAREMVDKAVTVTTRSLNTAYKPVVFLAVLDCMGERGHCLLDDVAIRFLRFYEHRNQSGLVVEAPGASIHQILAANGDAQLRLARDVLLRHPLRIILGSRLLTLHGNSLVAHSVLLESLRYTELLVRLRSAVGTAIAAHFAELGGQS